MQSFIHGIEWREWWYYVDRVTQRKSSEINFFFQTKDGWTNALCNKRWMGNDINDLNGFIFRLKLMCQLLYAHRRQRQLFILFIESVSIQFQHWSNQHAFAWAPPGQWSCDLFASFFFCDDNFSNWNQRCE